MDRTLEFNDDRSRLRTGFAAKSLAIMGRMAINPIRLNTSRRASIKTKRLLAATSDQFRPELLAFYISQQGAKALQYQCLNLTSKAKNAARNGYHSIPHRMAKHYSQIHFCALPRAFDKCAKSAPVKGAPPACQAAW